MSLFYLAPNVGPFLEKESSSTLSLCLCLRGKVQETISLIRDYLSPNMGAGSKMMKEITDQTGNRTRVPFISSQMLKQLSYLAPVSKPVIPSHSFPPFPCFFLNDFRTRKSPRLSSQAGVYLVLSSSL